MCHVAASLEDKEVVLGAIGLLAYFTVWHAVESLA